MLKKLRVLHIFLLDYSVLHTVLTDVHVTYSLFGIVPSISVVRVVTL